uniref:Coiled-coil domain-containing protein 57-like n=1 Tax=Phallusia mammillata TaxID=59560 RepID=A0A6F9D980_9ASCI|nr:coiled-coil domain-containing protein 57-like [Phallusia mammillata]
MDLKDIEQLAAQKENEWRSISKLRITTLQKELSEKSQLFNELNDKFLKLKEDFKYNLKLLQERDEELNNLDGIRQNAKIVESKFLSERSDLCIKIDNLKQKLMHEKEARDEMEIHYKQRLSDHLTQFEIFRTSKNNELEETTSELGKLKRQFEQKVHQLEAEIESQKVELVHEFEDMMKKRETDFKEKEAEIRNKSLSLEMKNKILSKELEYFAQKQDEHTKGLEEGEKQKEELKSKLQQAEWDVSDVSALKNARILELESQVQHFQAASRKQQDGFEKRRIQLDKDMRCKQANLLAAKQSQFDREKHYEEQIRKLQTELETSKMETSRSLWDANDMRTRLRSELENKQHEVDDLKCKLETIISDQSHSVVAKDTEIMTLHKRCNILKAENARMKNDIDKYQQDLAKSVVREQSLERTKAQLQLDWKRQCEEIESNVYAKSEDLTDGLRKSRDAAVADLSRAENKLNSCEEKLRKTNASYKVAVEMLRDHHLMAQYEKRSHDVTNDNSDPNQDLAEQNEQLRSVIKQMRFDMQQLLDERADTSLSTNASEKVAVKPTVKSQDKDPYVTSLENEIIEVNRQKRELEEKLQAAQENSEKVPQKVEVSLKHPTVQNHVESLNKNIANLEAEKIDLRAQVQKTQTSLEHQRALAHRHEQDSKTLSTKIQQLEYESTALRQRGEQETKQLKDQISDLTLQLAESRQEADQYYKGGLQTNLRAMELSGKISQMTMDLASNTPWVSSPVQAKLVQDLRDEVTQLRKKLAIAKQHILLVSDGKPSSDVALNHLQNQLKRATERIAALTEERNQLLESGNRMRADMMKLSPLHEEKEKQQEKEDEPTKLERSQASVKNPQGESPSPSKLQQMENLQYQLTKQELAFARHRPLPHHVKSISSESEESSVIPEKPDSESNPSHVSNVIVTSTPAAATYTSSSLDDSSIRDVWRILDAPSSPSVMGDSDGLKPKLTPAPKTTQASKLPRGAPRGRGTTLRPRIKPKIRNYNVRDDSAYRGGSKTSKK